MSMYRKEWGCCGSITETEAWEPEDCPFCKPLAQQAEPVAWECKAGGLKRLTQRLYDMQPDSIKRHYTRIAPPQRSMVPLTEGEIYLATGHCGVSRYTAIKIARVVEEASWEKNHG